MKQLMTKEEDYVPTVSFSFPKDNKKAIPAPDNFDQIKVDSKIKVIVSGEVASISHDEYGKSFSIKMKKLKIAGLSEEPLGVGEAMAGVKKERTM